MAHEDMEVSFQQLMGKTDTSCSFPLLVFFVLFFAGKIHARAFAVVVMFTCQSVKRSFNLALAQNVSFFPNFTWHKT